MTAPVDAGVAKVDPEQVYVVSRLVNSPYVVFSPASDLEDYAIGISSYDFLHAIKVQGDEVVYQEGPDRVLRRFSLDVAGSPPRDDLQIPEDALDDNDSLVATPGCGDSSVNHFAVSPQGALVYDCLGSPYVWYSGADQVANGIIGILALGNDGLAIVNQVGTPGTIVRNLAGGEPHPVPELDEARLSDLVFRAHGDTFHVAAVRPAVGSDAPAELWEVSSTGAVTVLGTYPALPNSTFGTDTWYALDANDVLYAYAYVSQLRYQLVRLTLEGDVTEIEPAEDSDVLFEPKGSLFTGP